VCDGKWSKEIGGNVENEKNEWWFCDGDRQRERYDRMDLSGRSGG